MVTISQSKVLVIEDETDKREFLEKHLIDQGIKLYNLKSAACAEEARDLISKFFPDVVLLDVKIPFAVDGVPDSKNSAVVLDAIESHNNKFEAKIKTIIISATTEDRGLQRIIESDVKKVFKMMDKSLLAQNPEKFKAILNDEISKALNTKITFEKPVVSILQHYHSLAHPLSKTDLPLYEFLTNHILVPFESMNEKTESLVSQAIIIRCGMVVEDLIQQMNVIGTSPKRKLDNLSDLDKLKSTVGETENSVRSKLITLSGRKYNYENKKYEISGPIKISRQACEFAQVAYRNRNHASHNGKDDKNENIYTDKKYTQYHATVSIAAIMPLVSDYIKYKSA